MAVNDDLLDKGVSHAIGLHRYGTGVVTKIQALLNKLDKELVKQINRRGADGTVTTARLRALLNDVKEISSEAYTRLYGIVRDDMQELAKYESDFNAKAINETLPKGVEFNLTKPTAALLKAIVTTKPFEGALLKDWVRGLDQGARRRLQGTLQQGVAAGESVDSLVRRVRGTKALNYQDGVMAINRRSAEAVVRTATNHVTSQAREILYEENKDLIKGVRWVSTLDKRTTPICRARDGKVYKPNEGPRPPAHINCRSTTVPITKSWKELGLDVDEIEPGTRASMDGQVPEELTYDDWLRKQPKTTQDEILGKQRADLFRNGLTMDKFIDHSGRALTLEQLARREAQKQPPAPEFEHEKHRDDPMMTPKFEGLTPLRFKEETTIAYREISSKVRRALVDFGTQVKAAAFTTDALPDLKGVQPTGYPAGSTFDDVEGVYTSGSRTAVTSRFNRTQTGRIIDNTRAAAVMKHEIGHAFDHAMGWYSSRPEFMAAYQLDVAKLTVAQRADLEYYLQPGSTGPKEAFAECFANANKARTSAIFIDTFFPNCSILVRRLL